MAGLSMDLKSQSRQRFSQKVIKKGECKAHGVLAGDGKGIQEALRGRGYTFLILENLALLTLMK